VLRRNVKKVVDRMRHQEEEHKQTLEELRGEIAQKLMDAQQVMLLPEYGKWAKEKKKKHEDLVAELKLEAQRIRTLERAQALGQEMAAAQAAEAEAGDGDQGGGGGGDGVDGKTGTLGDDGGKEPKQEDVRLKTLAVLLFSSFSCSVL
jgi:membrane protein involved in colicin uptake